MVEQSRYNKAQTTSIITVKACIRNYIHIKDNNYSCMAAYPSLRHYRGGGAGLLTITAEDPVVRNPFPGMSQDITQLTHSPLDKNDCHFADDIFRCIVVKEKFCILIKISLKFVPMGLIDNIAVLV